MNALRLIVGRPREEQTVPEWLKILLSALSGGVISGGFLLLADYLRHRRRRVERCQEILTEKRIEACQKLMQMLVELREEASPLTYGAEVLRYPKTQRSPADLTDAQKEHAKRLDNHIGEIGMFLITNQMYLGAAVMRTMEFHWGAFRWLRFKLTLPKNSACAIEGAVEKVLFEIVDKAAEAIEKEFGDAGITFVPSEEWRNLRREGQSRADKLVDEEKQFLDGKEERN
jgi:hypothetical protein